MPVLSPLDEHVAEALVEDPVSNAHLQRGLGSASFDSSESELRSFGMLTNSGMLNHGNRIPSELDFAKRVLERRCYMGLRQMIPYIDLFVVSQTT